MFVMFLPSNSRVSLVDQRDGQIQTVVREFVLRIGATTNKEQLSYLVIFSNSSGLNSTNKHP